MKISRLSCSRAFTLVEALVTMTIAGFVTAGVLAFYVANLQYQFVGEQKLLINSDIRNFTEQMMTAARDANYVLLYRCFYNYTTSNSYTGQGGTITTSATSTALTYDKDASGGFNSGDEVLATGVDPSGDYLVFVSYTNPFYGFSPANVTTPVPNPKVLRIVAYWVAPNRNYPGEIALYSFDTNNFTGGTTPWNSTVTGAPITFPVTIPASNAIESLLPPNTLAWAQNTNFKIVLNDIRGLSSDNTGLSFTNYTNQSNTSILMRSLILHGNAAKRVTDTYNFTITPRG